MIVESDSWLDSFCIMYIPSLKVPIHTRAGLSDISGTGRLAYMYGGVLIVEVEGKEELGTLKFSS